ncbi:MAG: hypothetical protein QOD94_2104 [Alphaproteobacteria bacterium]|jgi:hypothetical protein|nr:hypothetical protein [Alphaproteobacteria bacterium]
MSAERFIVSTGLRGKVERLLGDEIRASDLHELFFDMRDEAGGSGLISEVANFIAHPHLRTQGLVWRDVNDVTSFVKFRAEIDNPIFTPHTIPASVPDVLRANLMRTRKSALTRGLGMKRSQAGAILERILNRSLAVSPGRLSKLKIETAEESRVFAFIASLLKGGPLFTESDLFEISAEPLRKRTCCVRQRGRCLGAAAQQSRYSL